MDTFGKSKHYNIHKIIIIMHRYYSRWFYCVGSVGRVLIKNKQVPVQTSLHPRWASIIDRMNTHLGTLCAFSRRWVWTIVVRILRCCHPHPYPLPSHPHPSSPALTDEMRLVKMKSMLKCGSLEVMSRECGHGQWQQCWDGLASPPPQRHSSVYIRAPPPFPTISYHSSTNSDRAKKSTLDLSASVADGYGLGTTKKHRLFPGVHFVQPIVSVRWKILSPPLSVSPPVSLSRICFCLFFFYLSVCFSLSVCLSLSVSWEFLFLSVRSLDARVVGSNRAQ